ncbi:meso-diaminopimelate D-dehydrogenase [Bacteroides reticulotermitis JCM 10512]|uniref:Meso-diaminopimelate D-dehydrogenase n=1 Tax=Bacteroides reticulotermitis JCM 10512 TaxID=1445607 RepID=W4V191_9BACE|nr:meso-diaminopimelate D-dehydrogenase [Bacteroides reticulotermitis JCM 10512]
MKKVRAAIVGYGNIGHYVLEALQAAPDFEIAGVVRRAGAENKPKELADYLVVKDINKLENVEVAILCTPTRSVEKYAKEYLAMGINTVDSFDIHTGIVDLRRTLNETARHTMPFPLSPPDGIREAIRLCAPYWKPSRPKELHTPTSVPA